MKISKISMNYIAYLESLIVSLLFERQRSGKHDLLEIEGIDSFGDKATYAPYNAICYIQKKRDKRILEKETETSKERDRILRILNQQITTSKSLIKNWTDYHLPPISCPSMPKAIAEKQLVGLECELNVCLVLREKMFGIRTSECQD